MPFSSFLPVVLSLPSHAAIPISASWVSRYYYRPFSPQMSQLSWSVLLILRCNPELVTVPLTSFLSKYVTLGHKTPLWFPILLWIKSRLLTLARKALHHSLLPASSPRAHNTSLFLVNYLAAFIADQVCWFARSMLLKGWSSNPECDFPNNTNTLFASPSPHCAKVRVGKTAGVSAQTRAVVPACPTHCIPQSHTLAA